MEIPAISVIIPIYNAKDYIGKCLDSLLAQTFQNFEVIVVDDKSTDGSLKIVGSYEKKFKKRFKSVVMEKNSRGKGYVPRNVGILLATGEYVLFLDADDFLAENALETLYTAAKENEADVVYTTAYYDLNNPNSPDKFKTLKDAKPEENIVIDEPNKNINSVFSGEYFHSAWTKFVQRDLLRKNEIFFPDMATGGSFIWSVNLCCHSKRLLRLSTPVYFRRSYSLGLVTRAKKRPGSEISFWVSAFAVWLKALNELANKNEILKNNFAQHHKALLEYFNHCLNQIPKETLDTLYSKDIYATLLRYFKDWNDPAVSTVPFFFSAIANREKAIKSTKTKLNKLTVDLHGLEARPLISIIIPMYNAEKFIGELLDSVLVQTLKNFEIIIVDDCSKDGGYKVVESYIPKFGGRLKLLQMARNSGAAPGPRNKGFLFSQGEYIFFMDADDALTKTALEEMYTLAKDHKADVVYCEKYFMSKGFGKEFMDNIYPADSSIQLGGFVDKPTFVSEDLAERLKDLAKRRFWVTPWQRLVKRDLLAENHIVFPEIIGSDDVVWCFQVLCCAKKFLRVPNSCYIRRMSDESFTKSKKSPNKFIRQWSDVVIRGLKFAANFMDRLKFFQENPNHRYEALNILSKFTFGPIAPVCADLEDEEIYDIFMKEFAKETGEHSSLISFLCTRVVEGDKIFREYQREIKKLREELRQAQNLNDECKTEIRRLKNGIYGIANMEGNSPTPNLLCPAVSIVIPMYNAEKYIGECLDSLLAQTFQAFEVIVVDDCSTDKSVEIVKSYMPKFKGMLKLTRTKKNSGGGGYVPRNIGLNFAEGEYICFVDADDFLIANALETLYAAATEFDADVVCTTAYYNLTAENEAQKITDDMKENSFAGDPDGKPNLLINSPNKNLESLLFAETMPACWRKFVRRKFLINNQISFPEILNGGDFIWTINLYCNAGRFLRISSPLYFYRSYTPNSVLRKKKSPAEQIFYRVSSFITWSRAFSDLTREKAILNKNPGYCHRALTLKLNWCMWRLLADLNRLNHNDLYEILCRELGKGTNPGDLTALALIFSGIILEKRDYDLLKQRIADLESELLKFKNEE